MASKRPTRSTPATAPVMSSTLLAPTSQPAEVMTAEQKAERGNARLAELRAVRYDPLGGARDAKPLDAAAKAEAVNARVQAMARGQG